MLRSLIAAVLALAFIGSVAPVAPARAHELVTRTTLAGPITVDVDIADRMVGFTNDAYARGFRGPVHCWSAKYDRRGRRTHVEHSRHYTGDACDFAQHRVKGRRHIATHAVMYRVADLAKKWGFRDGCTFRDCGHIDERRNSGIRLAAHKRPEVGSKLNSASTSRKLRFSQPFSTRKARTAYVSSSAMIRASVPSNARVSSDNKVIPSPWLYSHPGQPRTWSSRRVPSQWLESGHKPEHGKWARYRAAKQPAVQTRTISGVLTKSPSRYHQPPRQIGAGSQRGLVPGRVDRLGGR